MCKFTIRFTTSFATLLFYFIESFLFLSYSYIQFDLKRETERVDSGRDTGMGVVEVDVERDCGSRTSKVKFCNRYLVIYPVYDAT